MRRSDGAAEVEMTGGGVAAPPEVRIEVCRCGCSGEDHGTAAPAAAEPDWALATAWSWLTRTVPAVDDQVDGDLDELDDELDEPDAADLPWWDARSSASRRRAVLPLVLLGELQAGVLLRAVWEVVQTGSGPTA